MLSLNQLQTALTALIRGKSDIVLYGNKGSGKTHLINKVLKSVLGEESYLSIKCIFLSDRNSLLYLITQQLKRVLRHLDSQFIFNDFFGKKQQEEDFKIGIDAWINKMNKMITKNTALVSKIPRLYIFLDNVQDFCLSQTYFKDFYFALKSQLKILKFSFVFCGITFKSQLFSISEPLRLLPTFFMPKPNIKDLTDNIVNNSSIAIHCRGLAKRQQQIRKESKLNAKKLTTKEVEQKCKPINSQINSLKKLMDHLKVTLVSTFDSIEYEIQRILMISKCFVEKVSEYLGEQKQKRAFQWLKKKQKDENAILDKLKKYGAVTLERIDNQIIKNQQGNKSLEQGEGQATFYLENYPNLINLSILMANGYPESEDKNRFIDLRQTKSAAQKSRMKNFQNAQTPFKEDPKKMRHTKQRIIAISEVLQDQANTNRFREKSLPHHSLDYFGCFQYMREEGYFNYYGSHKAKFGGTIMGHPKESEYKEFMQKINLNYKQFTGKD